MSRYESSARITDYERHSKELLEKIERLGVEELEVEKLKLDSEALQFEEKEAVEILADSYKRRRRWLNYPIVQKGTNLVISGTHRVLAAKKNGQKSILCHIIEAEPDEIWAVRIEENLTRRRLTKDELRYWMQKARDQWGWTQDLISQLVGLSPGRVSQILSDKPPKPVEESLEIKESEPTPPTPETVGMEQYIPQDQGASAGSESGAPPLTFVQGTEFIVHLPVGLTPELAPGEATIPFVIEDYNWTLPTIRDYEGKVNAYIRAAGKHASEPDRRVWLESVYEFVKGVLGYSV